MGKNVLPHLSDRRSVRRSTLRFTTVAIALCITLRVLLSWVASVVDTSNAATVGTEP